MSSRLLSISLRCDFKFLISVFSPKSSHNPSPSTLCLSRTSPELPQLKSHSALHPTHHLLQADPMLESVAPRPGFLDDLIPCVFLSPWCLFFLSHQYPLLDHCAHQETCLLYLIFTKNTYTHNKKPQFPLLNILFYCGPTRCFSHTSRLSQSIKSHTHLHSVTSHSLSTSARFLSTTLQRWSLSTSVTILMMPNPANTSWISSSHLKKHLIQQRPPNHSSLDVQDSPTFLPFLLIYQALHWGLLLLHLISSFSVIWILPESSCPFSLESLIQAITLDSCMADNSQIYVARWNSHTHLPIWLFNVKVYYTENSACPEIILPLRNWDHHSFISSAWDPFSICPSSCLKLLRPSQPSLPRCHSFCLQHVSRVCLLTSISSPCDYGRLKIAPKLASLHPHFLPYNLFLQWRKSLEWVTSFTQYHAMIW